MGQIKVTTPENANQIEVDENRKLQRKPIVKSDTLSNMEDLQNYVPQRTNALLDTELIKYEELQHKIPERSIPTDASVIDWYPWMGRRKNRSSQLPGVHASKIQRTSIEIFC